MSGGFVRKQKAGDHQVVMFTFAGELTDKHAKAWNDAILQLKRKFKQESKAMVTGVTMEGHTTPKLKRT
jgi:hypothetical protein